MIPRDGFNNGYKAGLEQARNGEGKNFRKVGLRKPLVSPKYVDEFIKGLNQGYLDGLRETSLVHKNTSVDTTPSTQNTTSIQPSGTTSMNPVIEGQIETLNRLKEFLKNFSEQLEEASSNYAKFVDELGEQALDRQVHERYDSEFVQQNRRNISNIVEFVRDQEIPHVDKVIGDLEEFLNQFG